MIKEKKIRAGSADIRTDTGDAFTQRNVHTKATAADNDKRVLCVFSGSVKKDNTKITHLTHI